MLLRGAVVLMTLVSAQAIACTCPEQVLADSLAAAHVAFRGRVVSSLQFPNILRMRIDKRLVVDVEQVWSDERLVFSKTFVNPGEPPCMSRLVEGGSYVFFGDIRDGVLIFDRCSGTRAIKHGELIDLAGARSATPLWPVVLGAGALAGLTFLLVLRAIRRTKGPFLLFGVRPR